MVCSRRERVRRVWVRDDDDRVSDRVSESLTDGSRCDDAVGIHQARIPREGAVPKHEAQHVILLAVAVRIDSDGDGVVAVPAERLGLCEPLAEVVRPTVAVRVEGVARSDGLLLAAVVLGTRDDEAVELVVCRTEKLGGAQAGLPVGTAGIEVRPDPRIEIKGVHAAVVGREQTPVVDCG